MLVKKSFRIDGEEFRKDPTLFDRVEHCIREKQWLFLLGETPKGAVLMTVDDGVTFHYKMEEDEHADG